MSYPDFDLWHRAQNSIAQGALTNSKHPERHVLGIYPTHIKFGQGSYLVDHEDRRYTDYICALGANFYGYGNPHITEKIREVMGGGFSHSLPTHHEVEAAEQLKEIFYFVDQWKFLKSGTEACNASLRIARAHTGRPIVLSEHYHGWGDQFVSLTPPANGVVGYHNIEPLQEYIRDKKDLSNVAAIIIEPVVTDYSDKRREELQFLRELCDDHGILLIFDEVITSFRFKKYSVAQYFNILPDLFIIGKAMANGMPLAAVGGKKKVMNGNYFISTTFAGEILSFAACKGVCDLIRKGHANYNIDRIWEYGGEFVSKFNKLAEPHIRLDAYPTRGAFHAESMAKTLFFQEACKAGMLFCSSWFYNFDLISEDQFFFDFLKDFMVRLREGKLKLEGQMPISPFAERVRDGTANGIATTRR